MRVFTASLGLLPVVALGKAAAFDYDQNCTGGLIPTPTYGLTQANFSVCAESLIKGTPDQVYYAILDYKNYNKWNGFVYEAVPPAGVNVPNDVKVGMGIQFSSTGIPPGTNSTATDVISNLIKNKFASWTNTEYDAIIGHSEHCLYVQEESPGYTRFRHWQTQLGAEAGYLYDDRQYFQTEFEVEAQDLKTYIEGQSKY